MIFRFVLLAAVFTLAASFNLGGVPSRSDALKTNQKNVFETNLARAGLASIVAAPFGVIEAATAVQEVSRSICWFLGLEIVE